MRKNLKVLIATVFMFILIAGTDTTVMAETVRENEPNDTMETAELIKANNETIEAAVNPSDPGQFIVKGTLGYNKDATFTPSLTVSYAYPVYSTMVPLN